MRPSNMFEDITEEEFNQREMGKKSYQIALLDQMNEQKERKRQEKERRERQEMQDEAKIKFQLNQMREAFRREENPDSRTVQVASTFNSAQANISPNKLLQSPATQQRI